MSHSDFATLVKALALAVIPIAALPAPGPEKLFSESIRPVFEKSCLPCHGPQTKSAGLDLSTRDGLLRGGARGASVVPGDPKGSLLYKLVAQEAEPHMPYKSDPLPKETIDRIAEWIKAGAPYEENADAGVALFREHVRTVLETNCVKCHNAQLKRSGLDLTTHEALLRGGDTGPVVVPGDAKSSVLYRRVSHMEQPAMPFGGQKLPDGAITQIADWINAGAPYDAPLAAGKAQLSHWAFKVPQRP